uniref:lysoplasmalogenase n=1 Tax=Anopheles stephensi TaxID=30069 RepID=A0A182YQH2_ANOST
MHADIQLIILCDANVIKKSYSVRNLQPIRLGKYQKRIMYGLLFSSFGDFLLNYDLFETGMGAFGVAQVFYIWAFGMKPLKLWIGVTLYLSGFFATAVFFGNLNSVIKTYIMVTYYFAQVGITLSVNDVQLNESTGVKKNSQRQHKKSGTKSN